ncbi:hypothetical protein S7711_11470 [Stachybotrys chartarum IBT 7711]|uniref:Uncharacterized protein n=1 Tax=Stachybotrys chartarum (strain CBS 109288 / IBT 7711) TaxID=1280523 RepID=A0A084B1E7_STACB|nr:hypothetical protein S7711_11470 [Stachybotrys chartarum IBT 7711]
MRLKTRKMMGLAGRAMQYTSINLDVLQAAQMSHTPMDLRSATVTTSAGNEVDTPCTEFRQPSTPRPSGPKQRTEHLLERLVAIFEKSEPSDSQVNYDPEAERKWEDEARELNLEAQKEPLEKRAFPMRLAIAGMHFLIKKDADDKKANYSVMLSTLQRMVLHDLQQQLFSLAVKLHSTKFASPNAVRDYDYMVEKVNQAKELDFTDPFEISTRRRLGKYLFKDANILPEEWNETVEQPPTRGVKDADYRRLGPDALSREAMDGGGWGRRGHRTNADHGVSNGSSGETTDDGALRLGLCSGCRHSRG